MVTPSGVRPADVRIRQEAVAELLEHDSPDSEGVILDVEDLAVLPGLVALHPVGFEGAGGGGIVAASRESAEGGVTTLVDLSGGDGREADPATDPLKPLLALQGVIRVDCGLVVPLGRAQVWQVARWIEAGVLGIEASLLTGPSGPLPTPAEADLRAVMSALVQLGRPLVARPGDEVEVVRLLIRLCRETRCRVHLVQPTASEAWPLIAEGREEGLPITVETSPGHLAGEGGGRLLDALELGRIDAIGPDHRPGRGDLRSALPATWALVKGRGLGLDSLVRWMAAGPANTLGLSARKGAIEPGLDADFVLFDPDASGPTPGTLGRVEMTILRGNMIYHSGRTFENPRGAVVLRMEETEPFYGSKS